MNRTLLGFLLVMASVSAPAQVSPQRQSLDGSWLFRADSMKTGLTEKWFLDSIHDAIARGIIIFNVSQCDGGRVNQGQYQTSKYLKQVGVVSGSDITAEAAITKMMYIFAKELDAAKSAELLGMSLRGEMTI